MNDLNKELIARGTAAAAVGIANSRGIKVRLGRQNDYPLAVTSGEERREIVTLKGKSGRVSVDCVMSCQMSKNIVSTAINGMSGTIKEFVSEGDLIVNMEVTLVGQGDNYPTEEVEKLCSLLRENESLSVESETLNDIYEVTRLVVSSWSMKPTRAYNYQTISIAAASDEAYIIMEEIEA